LWLMRSHDRSQDKSVALLVQAAAEHPWWKGGAHDVWRFYNWAKGDSLLNAMYPGLTYRTAPNSTELAALLLLLAPCMGVRPTVAAIAAVKAMDAVLDLFVNCLMPVGAVRGCPCKMRTHGCHTQSMSWWKAQKLDCLSDVGVKFWMANVSEDTNGSSLHIREPAGGRQQ
jgi:hypothetical protein